LGYFTSQRVVCHYRTGIHQNSDRYHTYFFNRRKTVRNKFLLLSPNIKAYMSRRNVKTKLSLKRRRCSDEHDDDDEEYHPDPKVNVRLNVNTVVKTSSKGKQVESDDLLKSFIQHDSLEFHTFTREEAYHIRASLLEWYRKYRRRLPWRGGTFRNLYCFFCVDIQVGRKT
jgi:hypothetical protein